MFAGPNGSGKSTVIQYVRNYKTKKGPIDFGYYINADDIAVILKKSTFDFSRFNIVTTPMHFTKVCLDSGLINDTFTEKQFSSAYYLRSNKIKLKNDASAERMAQIIADYLRKHLLEEQKAFYV